MKRYITANQLGPEILSRKEYLPANLSTAAPVLATAKALAQDLRATVQGLNQGVAAALKAKAVLLGQTLLVLKALDEMLSDFCQSCCLEVQSHVLLPSLTS